MANIHPSAVVSPRAQLGHGVQIGPFCVVEDDVRLGDDCRLENGVVIKSGVRAGANNHFLEAAVIGGVPQHTNRPKDNGTLEIGSGNTFRELVTVHRALQPDSATMIGNDNYFMISAHVGHDCLVGNGAIIVNNVMLGGHVSVGDAACLGGGAGVHQFCRIGRLVMVAGHASITKDVPPFVTVDYATHTVVGLNLVGLRRAGFDTEQIAQLKAAYRLIYRSGRPWQEMLAQLQADFPDPPAAEFHAFFAGGKRGFTPERRGPGIVKMKDHPADSRAKKAA